MEPTFKVLLGGKPVQNTYRVSNIVKVNEIEAIIQMGDRSIVFRVATGEQGEEGPFPYVQLLENEEQKAGYCLTRESEFRALWRFLELTPERKRELIKLHGLTEPEA